MAYATIKLELFKSGIHLTCEETGADEFIPREDTDRLIEIISYIDIICNPDTIFSLTEKGKKYLEELEKENIKI
jgi:hypothetical protein